MGTSAASPSQPSKPTCWLSAGTVLLGGGVLGGQGASGGPRRGFGPTWPVSCDIGADGVAHEQELHKRRPSPTPPIVWPRYLPSISGPQPSQFEAGGASLATTFCERRGRRRTRRTSDLGTRVRRPS